MLLHCYLFGIDICFCTVIYFGTDICCCTVITAIYCYTVIYFSTDIY